MRNAHHLDVVWDMYKILQTLVQIQIVLHSTQKLRMRGHFIGQAHCLLQLSALVTTTMADPPTVGMTEFYEF